MAEGDADAVRVFDTALPPQHAYLGRREPVNGNRAWSRTLSSAGGTRAGAARGDGEDHQAQHSGDRRDDEQQHARETCGWRSGGSDAASLPDPGREFVACVLLFRKILLMPSETMPIRISSEFAREMIEGLDESSLVALTDGIRFPLYVGHLDCGPRRGTDDALVGRVGTLARLESVVSRAAPRHSVRGDVDLDDEEPRDWADVTISGAARFRVLALEAPTGLFHATARICVLPDESSGGLARIPASASAMPPFVRRAYDPVSLCARIVARGGRLLRPYGKDEPSEDFTLPRTRGETETFSYWLSRNLPLDMRTVRALLEINSTERRLLEILKFVSCVEETLFCGYCSSQLATTSNVIAMSEEGGTTGSYMNAHGFTHQLITLDSVRAYISHGVPTTEHTYFPGYAWTCISCRQCEFHIGWKYESEDPSMRPSAFFGLLRAVLSSTLSRAQ